MSRAAIILDSDFQRKKAADWVWALKDGTRVEFKGPKRTLDQNSLFWVLLTEVAVQLKWHGQKLTPDDWKIQFLDALRRSKREELHIVPNIDNTGFVNLSTSSSDLSKEEMTELIELIFAFGAAHGVTFNTSNAPAAANDAGSPTNLPDDTSQAPSGEDLADPTPLGETSSSAGNPAQNDPHAGAAATHSAEATQPAMVPDADTDSAGDPASNSAASAPLSSGEDAAGADERLASPEAPAVELSAEDRQWLRDGARMLLATLPSPDDSEAKDVLTRAVFGIRENTAATISVAARDKLREVAEHCMAVCKGGVGLDVPLVAKTALASVADITPQPVKTARAK